MSGDLFQNRDLGLLSLFQHHRRTGRRDRLSRAGSRLHRAHHRKSRSLALRRGRSRLGAFGAAPLDSHVCGLRRRGIPRRTTFGPLPRATWALDCTRTAPACGADARAAAAGRSAVRGARDGHGGSARRSSSPLTSTSFFQRPSSRVPESPSPPLRSRPPLHLVQKARLFFLGFEALLQQLVGAPSRRSSRSAATRWRSAGRRSAPPRLPGLVKSLRS